MSEYVYSLCSKAAIDEITDGLSKYPAEVLRLAMEQSTDGDRRRMDVETYRIKEMAFLRSMNDFWHDHVEGDDESIFPLTYLDLWNNYEKQLSCIWTPTHVTFAKDDFHSLSKGEKRIIKYIMGYFAVADSIVDENLAKNIMPYIHRSEAKCALMFQMAMENVHGEVYSKMIMEYIPDGVKRAAIFSGAHEMKAVSLKTAWAKKWMTESMGLAQNMAAFAIVEIMMFPVIFALILWFKDNKRNLEGFFKSNEYISRDERLHGDFAALIYNKYLHDKVKVSQATIERMITEAVEVEDSFFEEAFGEHRFPSMSADTMKTYTRFIADQTLKVLGYKPLFNGPQPLVFMDSLGMASSTDFFAAKNTNYTTGGGVTRFGQSPLDVAAFTEVTDI